MGIADFAQVQSAGSVSAGLDLAKLSDHWETGHASPAFCTTTSTAALVAGLFIELAATHFLLDAAMFDQLPKTTHRFLNRLAFTQTQLDHKFLLWPIPSRTLQFRPRHPSPTPSAGEHSEPRSLADRLPESNPAFCRFVDRIGSRFAKEFAKLLQSEGLSLCQDMRDRPVIDSQFGFPWLACTTPSPPKNC